MPPKKDRKDKIKVPFLSRMQKDKVITKKKRSMLDLGKQKIEVKCGCGKKHSASLNDVSNRRNIRCGCGTTIQLQDSRSSVRNSVSSINKSMKDLDRMFRKLGR